MVPYLFKGTICGFRRNSNINMNEVIIQSQKQLSFPKLNNRAVLRGNTVCLLERWQGPPHVSKVKQQETVLSIKVRVRVYLVCLGIKKLIKINQ